MLFFKTIKVPFSWRIMGETCSRVTIDILVSDIVVKYRIYKGEVIFKCFRTQFILSYYFTRPLTGKFSKEL